MPPPLPPPLVKKLSVQLQEKACEGVRALQLTENWVHPELKRGLGVSFWTGTHKGNPVFRAVTTRLQTCSLSLSLSATSTPLSNFNPVPSSSSLPLFLLNSGVSSHLVFCRFLCTISRESEGKEKFEIGGGLWKLVLKGQGDETFLGAPVGFILAKFWRIPEQENSYSSWNDAKVEKKWETIKSKGENQDRNWELVCDPMGHRDEVLDFCSVSDI